MGTRHFDTTNATVTFGMVQQTAASIRFVAAIVKRSDEQQNRRHNGRNNDCPDQALPDTVRSVGGLLPPSRRNRYTEGDTEVAGELVATGSRINAL